MLSHLPSLPTYVQTKMHSFDCQEDWLCFLASGNQVHLISLAKTNIHHSIIHLDSQPVKAISLLVPKNKESPLIGIATLSKYHIYRLNKAVTSYSQRLTTNIVDLKTPFVAMDSVEDKFQCYFVMMTCQNAFHIVSVQNLTSNCKAVQVAFGADATSMAMIDGKAVVGNVVGDLTLLNLAKAQSQKTVKPSDNMPVLLVKRITLSDGQTQCILVGNCYGQLYSYDSQLNNCRLVSLHPTMIRAISVLKNGVVVTVADDTLSHQIAIEKDLKLTIVKSWAWQNKVSMVFGYKGLPYFCFFENLKIVCPSQ